MRWRQLAKPLEVRHPRKCVDTDEAEASVSELSFGEPAKVPDEQQLVEQVVLAPDDDFIVRCKSPDRLVPLLVRPNRVVVAGPSGVRDEPRPDLASRACVDVSRGHGSLMEDVGPNGKVAGHSRPFQRLPGGIAIQQVQEPRTVGQSNSRRGAVCSVPTRPATMSALK